MGDFLGTGAPSVSSFMVFVVSSLQCWYVCVVVVGSLVVHVCMFPLGWSLSGWGSFAAARLALRFVA